MEEEIITPEEEVFDYHKLRYILDSDGYILHTSFGGLVVCDLGECTEYNGEVPSGYETIEEWFDNEIDRLNAWKIVEGNLVFDENKYNELQLRCEKEEEENATATHKWVKDQLGKSSQVVIDELSSSVSGTSLIVINDSGEYEIPTLNVSSETIEECEVLVSNKNLLGNDAVTQTLNGVTFTINEDKTITLNGTATANIELNLKGTSNNLDMLFLIQKETNYVVGGLTNGVNLNLYNFDGTDRTLIGTYGNEAISLNNNEKVTQASLVIASGTKLEKVTISPQIEINDVATDYIEHKENKVSVSLYDKEATIYDLYSYNPVSVIMADEEINIEVSYFRYKSLEDKFASISNNIDSISTQVSQTTESINNTYTEVVQLQTEVTQNKEAFEVSVSQLTQTINTNNASMQESIDNINDTISNGVELVKNNLVTIDINGISVTTNTSAISTLLSNDRFSIKTKSDDELFFVGYDYDLQKTVSRIDNLTVTNYLTAGYHRTEGFVIDGENRSGDFYVGE